MPLDGAAVANAATKLLAFVSASLAADGLSVPTRQYIAAGAHIAPDGEQLVVGLGKLDEGQPGIAGGGYAVSAQTFNALTLNVSLLRKVPALSSTSAGGKASIPTAAKLATAGANVLLDAVALWNAGRAIKADPGQIFGLAPNQPIVIGPLMPWGPEGGLAGHVLTVAWSFDQ